MSSIAVDHVVVAGGVDRVGRLDQADAERRGDSFHRLLGERPLEPHAAAEEIVRVDDAEHDVGVGHGRLAAAGAVAGWARHGAGALRPDVEQAARIDPGDRAAAGADRTHVDLGDAEHVVAEARLGRDDQLAVAQRRDVEGGAAHVADDHVGLLGQRLGGDRRERRARHHAVDRPLGHLIRRHHAADAVRHQQLAGKAGGRETLAQLADVGADDRVERGIDRRRDDPPILARDRVELVAERDWDLRPFLADDLARPALVRAIGDRPQQARPRLRRRAAA